MNASQTKNVFGGKWMVLATIGPALTLYGLFVLWPAVDAFSVSLFSWTGYAPTAAYVGLENFERLIRDHHFWRSLANTLHYVVVGGIAHFSFAFLFAWGLHHPRFRGKKVFQTLIFFPAFISVVGVGVLWLLLYEQDTGLFNQLVKALGFEGTNWLSPEHGMNAIIVTSVWAGVGGHMVILLAGLRRIPPHLLNAARLDGANELAVFWYVTLPLLRNVTYAALALWLIGSMQIFGLIQVMVPYTPELQTVSTYHYAISFSAFDHIYMMGRGTAMAIILLAMILILVALVRLLFGRKELEY